MIIIILSHCSARRSALLRSSISLPPNGQTGINYHAPHHIQAPYAVSASLPLKSVLIYALIRLMRISVSLQAYRRVFRRINRFRFRLRTAVPAGCTCINVYRRIICFAKFLYMLSDSFADIHYPPKYIYGRFSVIILTDQPFCPKNSLILFFDIFIIRIQSVSYIKRKSWFSVFGSYNAV